MGRVSKKWIPLFLGSIAAVLVLLSLSACENALQEYFFKYLFYDGWKIASWTLPNVLIDGETHEQTGPPDLSNGFPMGMAVGDNDKVHVIGLRVSEHEWVYTSKASGADRFDQLYTAIDSAIRPGGLITSMPHIDPISGDALMIAFSDEVGVDDHLFFQEYGPVSGWKTAEDLYNPGGPGITQTFVFFMTKDYKPHLFYVSSNVLYHTKRTSSSMIDPDPPEEYIADIGAMDIDRMGANDLAFVYSDSSSKSLYCRTFNNPQAQKIWSTDDPDTAIVFIDVAVGPEGDIHVCFLTRNPNDPMNPGDTSIRYLCCKDGLWKEMGSITGTDQAGPNPITPFSITVSTDMYGNSRLHLAYTLFKQPVNFWIWYAYYDQGSWHVAEESLDTVYTNSFWTFPMIAADQNGNVHVVYSWAVNELDRTLMYIRGTPEEPQ
jgi:hypothetical protein